MEEDASHLLARQSEPKFMCRAAYPVLDSVQVGWKVLRFQPLTATRHRPADRSALANSAGSVAPTFSS